MRYHTQNLNERRGEVIGSMFWRGRAWFYSKQERRGEILHIEWLFGKYARDFGLTASFGYGDSDSGVCLHLCLPWLFSVYLVIPHVYHCRETQTGIAIHNGGFWVYPLVDVQESRSEWPWWKKNHCWHFPWTLDWHSTEVLKPLLGIPSSDWPVVWSERKGKRKKDVFSSMDERKSAEQSVSSTHDYTYTLKSGEAQRRKATICVDRMTWRARWFPIIPITKSRTSIGVTFDDEVGEGTGSWKGGCTGCGYDLQETEMPLDCLRRMEAERKFDR